MDKLARKLTYPLVTFFRTFDRLYFDLAPVYRVPRIDT